MWLAQADGHSPEAQIVMALEIRQWGKGSALHDEVWRKFAELFGSSRDPIRLSQRVLTLFVERREALLAEALGRSSGPGRTWWRGGEGWQQVGWRSNEGGWLQGRW